MGTINIQQFNLTLFTKFYLINKVFFNKGFECVCVHVSEPEGVGPLMPAELAAYAVCDSGDKLSSQAQFRAQLQSKLLRRVLLLRHVPFKLVYQRYVPNVDV